MDECTHYKLDCRDCLDKVYRADLTAEADLELTRLRAELAEARALVEKREAQIEWLIDTDWGVYGVGTQDTRAGLLAAVDEATKSEPTTHPTR